MIEHQKLQQRYVRQLKTQQQYLMLKLLQTDQHHLMLN